MITPPSGLLRAHPSTSRRPVSILAVFFAALVVLSGCGDSGDDISTQSDSEQTTLADLNLSDRPLSGDDLDPAEEQLMRDSLAAEFQAELGVSVSEATCLSESVEVSDLLEAGSAENGGDGSEALERVLQGFDTCGIPRTVFEQ